MSVNLRERKSPKILFSNETITDNLRSFSIGMPRIINKTPLKAKEQRLEWNSEKKFKKAELNLRYAFINSDFLYAF